MTLFRLNQAEANTVGWLRLKEHMRAELAKYREQNDHALDDAKTAHIRGRIAQLKELLASDEPPPVVDP